MRNYKLIILFFFLTITKPVYAWMCTGQEDYPPFDICGVLFVPTLLLLIILLLCGIVMLMVSLILAFLKKNKVRAKAFSKFGGIALILAFLLLLLIFPREIMHNMATGRVVTSMTK